MGEKLPQMKTKEAALDRESAEKQLESIRESLEKQPETAPQVETIEKKARADVEKYARSAESFDSTEKPVFSSPTDLARDKQATYKQTLASVQQQLPPHQKVFSAIVHNPAVEKVGTAVSKTIGRPSILLGAFGFASVGGLIIYMVARSNGYYIDSHYTMYILLAVGGMVGLTYDVLRFIKRKLTN